jgi:hypothetical protein
MATIMPVVGSCDRALATCWWKPLVLGGFRVRHLVDMPIRYSSFQAPPAELDPVLPRGGNVLLKRWRVCTITLFESRDTRAGELSFEINLANLSALYLGAIIRPLVASGFRINEAEMLMEGKARSRLTRLDTLLRFPLHGVENWVGQLNELLEVAISRTDFCGRLQRLLRGAGTLFTRGPIVDVCSGPCVSPATQSLAGFIGLRVKRLAGPARERVDRLKSSVLEHGGELVM